MLPQPPLAHAAATTSRVHTLHMQELSYDASTIGSCSAFCAASFYSLAIISPDWRCRCSMQLPDEADRWRDDNCTAAAGSAAAGVPAAVYYLHAGAHALQLNQHTALSLVTPKSLPPGSICLPMPAQPNDALLERHVSARDAQLVGKPAADSCNQWQVCLALPCVPAASNATQCRLANLDFNKDNWNIAYSPE